eukprot:5737287-Pleurochrysis_carterae.AAC.2
MRLRTLCAALHCGSSITSRRAQLFARELVRVRPSPLAQPHACRGPETLRSPRCCGCRLLHALAQYDASDLMAQCLQQVPAPSRLIWAETLRCEGSERARWTAAVAFIAFGACGSTSATL